jgi:ABC-type uncharacterized transport system ATPase subunit
MSHPTDEQAGATLAPARTVAASGLTKRFGALVANDSVSLELRPGTVHVLLGENGAGKSTFMSMLYGHLRPDDGFVLVDGEPVEIGSPGDALAHGIGMVHQHFSLVPSYTAAQNVVLGSEPSAIGYSPRVISAEVRATVDRLGWNFDVDRRIEDLPISARQRVEILKLLHRGARTLLLDEPTALLSPAEIDDFLQIITDLRSTGAAILLVTHKLKEVEEVADEITVIRHGVITGHFDRGTATSVELARAMTGRDNIPEVKVTGQPSADAPFLLDVRGLSVGSASRQTVTDLSLQVRAGEILGIAAVEGNGQDELVAALCGLTPTSRGSIRLAGADVSGLSPRRIRAAGLAVIPADRREEGTVGDMTIAENLALNDVAAGRTRLGGLLDRRAMRRAASRAVTDYDIRPGRVEARANSLSGGNMQKLVIARELANDPSVVLAVSPTWGLDIGAVADVQNRLLQLRSKGCAVLLVSPDLDEILALSDRVVAMYRGKIAASFDRSTIDTDQLALALIGAV